MNGEGVFHSKPPIDMNPESTDQPQSDPDTTARRGTRETLDDLSRTLTEALRNGGRDARRAVEDGFPKVKSEFAQGLHEAAYAVAYAATFGAALVREVTPDSLRNGFREGATSGRRAAEEVMRQRREKAARETDPAMTDEGQATA